MEVIELSLNLCEGCKKEFKELENITFKININNEFELNLNKEQYHYLSVYMEKHGRYTDVAEFIRNVLMDKAFEYFAKNNIKIKLNLE